MKKLFLAEEKKVERNYEKKGSNYSIPWHSIIFRGRFFHQNASLHLTYLGHFLTGVIFSSRKKPSSEFPHQHIFQEKKSFAHLKTFIFITTQQSWPSEHALELRHIL